MDRHVAGPERGEGGGCGSQLGFQGAALPGDEDAPGSDEREPDLDELREAGDRPRRHHRPALPVPRVTRQGLGADGFRSHATLEAGRLDDRAEEYDLLGDRIHEQGPGGCQHRRQRQAREPAAAAEVEDPRGTARSQQRHRDEAVEDVEPGNAGRVPDRGQVDRGRPREEQADMAVEDVAHGRVQVETQVLQSRVEDVDVRGGQRREVLNTRRERISRAIQGTLPWSCTGSSGSRSRRQRGRTRGRRLGLASPDRFRPGFPRGPCRMTLPGARTRRADCGR